MGKDMYDHRSSLDKFTDEIYGMKDSIRFLKSDIDDLKREIKELKKDIIDHLSFIRKHILRQ